MKRRLFNFLTRITSKDTHQAPTVFQYCGKPPACTEDALHKRKKTGAAIIVQYDCRAYIELFRVAARKPLCEV